MAAGDTTHPDAMTGADAPSIPEAMPPSDGTTQPDRIAQPESGAPDGSSDAPSSDAPLADSPADVVPDAFVCPPAIDPQTNWLAADPSPADWLGNFHGLAPAPSGYMTATTECGQTAVHWVQSGVPIAAGWIFLYVDNPPFMASLQTGSSYTATFAVMGTAPGILVYLDVWDGGGSPGMGDNSQPPVALTPGTVFTFTQPFTEGTGTDPQIQLRWVLAPGSNASTVDVDLTIWNVAIQ
jgi:hypothetical protein